MLILLLNIILCIELRPLRQQQQDLMGEYKEKKQGYDSASLGHDSTVNKLEKEVKVG